MSTEKQKVPTESELQKFDTSNAGHHSQVLTFGLKSLSFQQLFLDTLTCVPQPGQPPEITGVGEVSDLTY